MERVDPVELLVFIGVSLGSEELAKYIYHLDECVLQHLMGVVRGFF